MQFAILNFKSEIAIVQFWKNTEVLGQDINYNSDLVVDTVFADDAY
jgi:hypothetical protein